ncbi:MAG: glycosyltransferase family 9 protein [Candidatus Krumholzibacteriia bacterium]
MTWTMGGRTLGSVLVTRLRYLGDIVMSTVVLDALRAGDPGLRLGYLCEAVHGPVLERVPGLDRIHLLDSRRRGADARARGSHPEGVDAGAGTPGTVLALRAARYDLACDLFFNPRSAWLLWSAGIPLRIGGSAGWRRRLYTRSVRPEELSPAHREILRALAPGGLGDHLCRLAPLRHVETGLPFLDWLERAGPARPLRPRLRRSDSPDRVPAALTALGIRPGEDYLVLVPGATWATKEWPLACWRELIDLLAKAGRSPLAVVLPPGKEAAWAPLAGAIPAGFGGLLPGLPLGEVLDVISGATGVVSVDGGIMHAAVGLGRPTVGLFGPTDPGVWFPYEGAGPFRVLATRPDCHPCNLHDCDRFVCLPELTAVRVARTLDQVLTMG